MLFKGPNHILQLWNKNDIFLSCHWLLTPVSEVKPRECLCKNKQQIKTISQSTLMRFSDTTLLALLQDENNRGINIFNLTLIVFI